MNLFWRNSQTTGEDTETSEQSTMYDIHGENSDAGAVLWHQVPCGVSHLMGGDGNQGSQLGGSIS